MDDFANDRRDVGCGGVVKMTKLSTKYVPDEMEACVSSADASGGVLDGDGNR